jgi:hypothetical protein
VKPPSKGELVVEGGGAQKGIEKEGEECCFAHGVEGGEGVEVEAHGRAPCGKDKI